MFSNVVDKEGNFHDFLFASLDYKTIANKDQLIKERICSSGSKFFPLQVDPYLERRQS